MSFLTKILGKSEEKTIGDYAVPDCTHASLVAHWDNPNDMGSEELASSWKCTSCGDEFSSDEREQFHAAELERVHAYQQEKADVENQRAEAEAIATARQV